MKENEIPSQDEIKTIATEFPKGTRVVNVKMVDPRPVPPGAIGTVIYVDAIGQIHVSWDNGSTLALIPIVDEFFKIKSLTG